MSAPEKLLPQSLEAEAGVLGSLLIDPDCIAEVSAIVAPADFYREAHREAYQASLDLYALRSPADLITLSDELARRGKLDDVGGIGEVSSWANQVPTSANAAYYARIVSEKATLRRLIHAAGQIAALAYNEPDATVAVEQAHKVLRAAESGGGRRDLGVVSFAAAADQFLADSVRSMQAGQMPGQRLGYRALDRHTMGLKGGEVAYLMARPRVGKSTLALGAAEFRAEQCAANGQGVVLYVTLEMKAKQQVQRLIAARSGVDGRMLRAHFVASDGSIHVGAYQRAKAAAEERKAKIGQHLLFYDTRASITTIRTLCDRVADEYGGIDTLVLDYIGLVASEDRRLDRYQQITQISMELKQLAMDLDMPVLCLVQMNRAVESREDRRPQLHDMKDSGGQEQDGDWVFGLYRGALYEAARAQGDPRFAEFAELLVLKAREGVDSAVIPLRFRGELTRFSDWPDDWGWPADDSRKVAEPEQPAVRRFDGYGAGGDSGYTSGDERENHQDDPLYRVGEDR